MSGQGALRQPEAEGMVVAKQPRAHVGDEVLDLLWHSAIVFGGQLGIVGIMHHFFGCTVSGITPAANPTDDRLPLHTRWLTASSKPPLGFESQAFAPFFALPVV